MWLVGQQWSLPSITVTITVVVACLVVAVIVWLLVSHKFDRLTATVFRVFHISGERLPDAGDAKEQKVSSGTRPDEADRQLTPQVANESSLTLPEARQVFNHLTRMDLELRNLLGSASFKIGKEKPHVQANALIRRVLLHAQEIFRALWPDAIVIVSLKAPYPDNPDFLACYYGDGDPSSEPESRLGPNGELDPEEVPVKGTVPGLAYTRGKPVFVSDLGSVPPGTLSAEAHADAQKKGIASIAAWPVRFRNEAVAVLYVDTNEPGSIIECEDVELVMKNITSKISFIFQIAERDTVALRDLPRRKAN